MNNPRPWLAIAAVVVLGVLGASLERGSQTSPQAVPQNGAIVWSHGRDGADANAEEHWEKHGGEFPEERTEMDYVRAANAFVHRPPAGTLIKHDPRGDTLFYQPSTDTFAVMDAAGEPRTFFKPDSGMAYWNRQ
jgi:pyocin large subunit-like protein